MKVPNDFSKASLLGDAVHQRDRTRRGCAGEFVQRQVELVVRRLQTLPQAEFKAYDAEQPAEGDVMYRVAHGQAGALVRGA